MAQRVKTKPKKLDSPIKSGNDGAKTIAGRVREAAGKLKQFSVKDLVDYDYGAYVPKKSVHYVVRDFLKSGEFERVCEGIYHHIPKPETRTRLDVIWHLIRSYRQFMTDEIERLSGAARATVLEYLHCLRKLGYLRQVKRGHWQLINDPGPKTPVNTAKCARLKRIRSQKSGARSQKTGRRRRHET